MLFRKNLFSLNAFQEIPQLLIGKVIFGIAPQHLLNLYLTGFWGVAVRSIEPQVKAYIAHREATKSTNTIIQINDHLKSIYCA